MDGEVVNRDGVWRKEFFSYAFAPKPRFGPPTVANPRADKDTGHEPDLECGRMASQSRMRAEFSCVASRCSGSGCCHDDWPPSRRRPKHVEVTR